MATVTLEQKRSEHHRAVEQNRESGVVQYKTSEKLSDAVYEVTEGYKYLPGGARLGPGQRFRPTVRQVEKGALRNKARELSATEYRGLTKPGKVFAGADFAEMEARAASNQLPLVDWSGVIMADSTREAAQAAGLVPEDFEGVEPEGAAGRFTRAQVDAMIAIRSSAEA